MARFTLKPFLNASGIVDQKALTIVCSTTRFQVVRRVVRPWLILTMLLLTHLVSESAAAQGRIIVMEKDLRPVGLPTSEVTWIPGATRKAEPVGTIPWDLGIGDELIGNTGTVTVKVRCNKTNLALSGRFDVRFLRAKEDGGCSVYYQRKAGSAINVDAGGPTEIQTDGAMRLGSKRTRYEVKTSVDQSDVPPEVLVFENEVFVESSGFSGTVKVGEQLVGGEAQIKQLRSSDYRQAAESGAKLDTSEVFRRRINPLTPSELRSTYEELLRRHQALLEAAKAQDDIATTLNMMIKVKRQLGTSGKLPPDQERVLTDLMLKFLTADKAFFKEIIASNADINAFGNTKFCTLFQTATTALADLKLSGIEPISNADSKSKLMVEFKIMTNSWGIIASVSLCP